MLQTAICPCRISSCSVLACHVRFGIVGQLDESRGGGGKEITERNMKRVRSKGGR